MKQIMKNKKVLLIILLMWMMNLGSCDGGRSDREIWESNNISDYHMDQTIMCFCLYNSAYNVQVKNDTLYAAIDKQNGEPVNLNFYSVNDLFDLIDHAREQNAYVLKVKYDDVYHFPKRIEIDYWREAIDDEITILVNHFGMD